MDKPDMVSRIALGMLGYASLGMIALIVTAPFESIWPAVFGCPPFAVLAILYFREAI